MIELSPFLSLNFNEQLLICVLLALPAALDWLSQVYGYRHSTNFVRWSTGFLEGTSVSLFSMAAAPLEFKFAAVLSIGGAISILGLVGKKPTSSFDR
jgi:hypothetical protein